MTLTPYYEADGIVIYHGNAAEMIDVLPPVELVATDPPYPNKAGHFEAGIAAAKAFLSGYQAPRWFVFWHQLEAPPVPLPLVGKHIWHRTNTNRQDNYEAIYEFADEEERASRVFPFPVIYEGLTGCVEATGHPTQKNLKLMRSLLQMRKYEGPVLDPFMGSGSTLRAAKDLGRPAIGIELEELWCEVAVKRLGQRVLFEEAS